MSIALCICYCERSKLISGSYYKIAALKGSLAMTGFAEFGVPPEPVIAGKAKPSLKNQEKSFNLRSSYMTLTTYLFNRDLKRLPGLFISVQVSMRPEILFFSGLFILHLLIKSVFQAIFKKLNT